MNHALAVAALSLTAALGAAALGSPAVAQEIAQRGNGNGNGNGNNGNGGATHGAPAPLIAGGIPGALALGGAYLAIRRRRRKG